VTRKRALIISGVATAVLGLLLLGIDPRARDADYPTIVDLEFAGTESEVSEIRDDWGDEGTDAAKRSLWIDFAYIVAYGTFLVLASAATRDLAADRGWRRTAAMGVAVVPFAAAAGAFDAIEDVGLLLAVDGHGGDFAPGLARVCASLKFLLLALTIAYLIAGIVLRLRYRSGAGRSARSARPH
jgi:hypothetical protein